jgi:hypothetical protein
MSWRRASNRDIAPAKLNPRRSPRSANTAASIVPFPSYASSWFLLELARPIRKPISRLSKMPKNSPTDSPTSFHMFRFTDQVRTGIFVIRFWKRTFIFSRLFRRTPLARYGRRCWLRARRSKSRFVAALPGFRRGLPCYSMLLGRASGIHHCD